MKERIFATWQRITLVRHRSELRALRRAKTVGLFAVFPIFITVFFWWFALCFPLIPLYLIGHFLIDQALPVARMFGLLLLVPLHITAFLVLLATAPWFFRWYFITLGLSFGRNSMAERMETELVAAIAAAEAANRPN